MSITITWEINKEWCVRDESDGFFREVVYRVKGLDDNEEKTRRTGKIDLEKPESLPSEFIPYNEGSGSPNQATMISWVKNYIGADMVKQIETNITNEINSKKEPKQVKGTAF